MAAGSALCAACAAHRRQAQERGAVAADEVVFIAYSIAGSQSDWDMHRYKTTSPGPADPSWMRTAGLAAHFGLMHRGCLDAGRHGPAHAFAVVPSLGGRPLPHPLESLSAYLLPGLPAVPLSAAANGRGQGDRDQRRVFRPDFLVVPDREAVHGRHIVLVDDTWVTAATSSPPRRPCGERARRVSRVSCSPAACVPTGGPTPTSWPGGSSGPTTSRGAR
ncbi:hypothetical protein GL263_23080 [Streptomyces durbertensis]|uniref:Phosphoribosyltransferase n=1 Tax=Streptomyces durbertensis TaxID=2448886 RepID=A0ABR6EM36_9ACTN|nr:hypothetical protein [Streptomyces durbertensis]MBB1246414.1 hypothetical protein [Streptomyces durbertensis]